MRGEKDFGLFVALIVGVQTAVIAIAGLLLKVGEKAVLWLIFGAIVAIGLAVLRAQAAGLGRIMEALGEIRADQSLRLPQKDE